MKAKVVMGKRTVDNNITPDIQSDVQFPAQQAADLMAIARLTEIYERKLHQSGSALGDKKAWNGENPAANKAAYDSMIEAAPPEVRDNIKVVQFDNTTAIVAYAPEDHSVTITFDPTSTRDNVLLNHDKMDNLARGHTDHSLGGEVHQGLYRDMVKEGPQDNDSMIDKIAGIVHEHAYNQETPLEVNFTGFSKGGAQAVLAAGEMMAEGLFTEDNHIELNNVIVFGTIAYGDEEYVQRFNKDAQELGAKVWSIELQGDTMPAIMTPDSPSYFTRYDYETVGNRAYITPEGDVRVNPDKNTLDSLRSQPAPEDRMHTSDNYTKAINAAATPEPQPAEQSETPEIITQPTPSLQI